jgi:LmbE family N-acetylglucosaminyl deacetylase
MTNRILAIGAHPDDIEYACGGTLLKARRRGDDVMLLTLSNGERGGATDTRRDEAQRASELLGAPLELLAFPDSAIPSDVTTVSAIESVVRAFAPTHVYTHSIHDTHQDHRAVHAAAIVAARSVPNVYCYQSPSATVDFRPSMYVEIAAFLDEKLALIDAYQSQIARRGTFDHDVIRSIATYWGRFAGYRLVEPFEVVRQIDLD